MKDPDAENNKEPSSKGTGPTRSFDGSVVGPGSQIGPFRIEQELGRGGAGVVYLAHDTKLDRSVAIKSLPPEVKDNPKALSRFTREARVLASLNHPNIATIHEVREEAEGLSYLVLEYIPGQTLAERIAKKPLKLEEALTIALQIAEAVAAAHEHDVIHRDLKPGNIKITPEGKVKVLDFGLAKVVGGEAMDQKTTITEPGRVIGTPAYMSPEQARGKPTDKRSDIWSFGCVLYEMLTAIVPFKGETISDTLANILDRDPNWQALPENTPINIQHLLRHCLDKEPRRRLHNISDIAITIEDTTADLQRSTLPSKSVKVDHTQTAKWSSRVLPWFITSAAVAVLLLIGIIIGLKVGQPNKKQSREFISQPIAETIKAIVVLPFDNLSGDPEQEYFVDGMREALGTELGKIRALTVKGQHSVTLYKGTNKQTAEIASELGVDAVIRGSVFKATNNVRITARLVHGPTEEQLWADSYEGDLSDVITLQREVALAIAKEIKVKLTPQEEERLASARPINPRAHDAYLKGRFFLSKRNAEGFKTAINYFEQAKDLETDYALAYVGLADCHILLGVYDFAPSREVFPQAKAEALRALKIDDSLGEAYNSLGYAIMCYDWDWSEAERQFQRAIELNPDYATVHQWYAVFLGWMGRFNEALVENERAQELEPFSLIIRSDRGNLLCLAGKHDESIEQSYEVLKMDPDFIPALYNLAVSHIRKSMFQENIAVLERAATVRKRDATSVAWLAFANAAAGNTREAQTLLQEALDRSKEEHIPPWAVSVTYAHLNDKDRAFDWLNKVIEWRYWSAVTLKVYPHWDPLRKYPEFDDVLEKMSFPETPVSETAVEPIEAAKAPIEKIAVPAIKTVSLEPLPPQTSLLISRAGSIAISSDGRYLVYVGVDTLGTRRLYLRDRMNDFEATPIRGTEGAMCPFFRPNGNWIGFFAKDESTAECALKRVRIQGGAPEIICTVPPEPCGGSWDLDDNIIFSPIYQQSLVSVSAFGGERKIFVAVDPNTGEFGHSWPDILPEQKGVLYTVWGGDSCTDYRTMIKRKGIDKPHELIPNSSFARYLPTGHIVFLREGSLQAVQFDIDHPGQEAIRGETEILLEDIGVTRYGGAQFAFSRDEGTLVYARGSTPLGLLKGEMVWVNPEESDAIPIPDSRSYYDEWSQPRLSPDENWIVLNPAYETNLLLYKFGTGWHPPLVSMKGYQGSAVWAPDGKHIAFHSMGPDSPPDVYWLQWNDDDTPELIHKDLNATEPTSFSPDGKYLAFTVHYVLETGLAHTSDIWILETATKHAEPWTNTQQCSEWGADFSPDGKWIAYTSDQMGEHEVYVREFPTGQTEKIGSGFEAMWGPDREKLELIYRDGKQLWRATIETEQQFKVVRREPLFDDVYMKARFPEYRNYDISKDGKRFLMIKQVDETPAPVTRLNVVVNWFEELKQFVPTEKK